MIPTVVLSTFGIIAFCVFVMILYTMFTNIIMETKVSIPSDGAEASQTTTHGCDDIQLESDDQFHTDQSCLIS
jgi:hypothetical protein